MTTEAGRRLFTRHADCQGYCEVWGERDAINAIEAEARAALLAELEAIDVGVYPASSPDGPRTPWQEGWNAGVIAMEEALDLIRKAGER